MNVRIAMLRRKFIGMLLLFVIFLLAPRSNAGEAGERLLEKTRQELRKAGFKTDLSEFDFPTSPELIAREAILKEAAHDPIPVNLRPSGKGKSDDDSPTWEIPFEPLDLLERVDSNSAAVTWKIAAPHSLRPLSDWNYFRSTINPRTARVERATAAILAGPIRLDPVKPGSGKDLPVESMKRVEELLDGQMILALHDGNLPAAWTNLLATTRVATAWDPGPAGVCHEARCVTTARAFNATWQALQTNAWTDAQLAQLQTEWESVDYFTQLPDTLAYQRAWKAAELDLERSEQGPDVSLGEFMAWAVRFPELTWEQLNDFSRFRKYLQHESYFDEAVTLRESSRQEVELRNDVKAQTWTQVRPAWRPSDPQFQLRKSYIVLLSHVAVADTRRRIIIAAIAIERYRLRHYTYPKALAEVVPEFLKSDPVDFMDGHPLRYRLYGSNQFTVYSVGLDCIDRGGLVLFQDDPLRFKQGLSRLDKSEIVWPLPASVAAAKAARLKQRSFRGLERYRGRR